MSDAAPAPPPPPFVCRRTEHGHVSTTTLEGELDIATIDELDRELTAGQATADLVIVDLRGLTFVDCVSAQAILAVDRRVRAAGGRLLLVRGPPAVQWTFELVDLQCRLEFVDEPPPLPRSTPPRLSVVA